MWRVSKIHRRRKIKKRRKIRKYKKLVLHWRDMERLIFVESSRFFRYMQKKGVWGVEYADMVQEGYIELFGAIDSYSIYWVPVRKKFVEGGEVLDRKPAKFQTYFVHKLRNRYRQIAYKHSLQMTECDLSLIEEGGGKYSNQELGVVIRELERDLNIAPLGSLFSPRKILKGSHLRAINFVRESLKKQ